MVSCALKADSELSRLYPAESSLGMRESRERAALEVVKSPMPSRSLRPPKTDPEGTVYRPGTKFWGFNGAFQ